MDYKELKRLFCEHESGHPGFHLTAYITFSSFGPAGTREFSWEGRTYSVSSNNKAFQPNMGGCSIFGSSLDGANCCIRLERYMAEEHGGKNGWVVEDCCVVGTLLMEFCSFIPSQLIMFYAYRDAVDFMLSRLAETGHLNLGQLEKDCAANNGEYDGDWYKVGAASAHMYGNKEPWEWSIKPALIYSPLRIEFADDPR